MKGIRIIQKYGDRFLILFVRVLTLGVRFLFNLIIIKSFSLEDYGTYSLFYTTITLFVILAGLDFYNYNTRELLGSNEIKQRQLLGDQLMFHVVTYLIFIPLSYPVLHSFVPDRYIFIFYLIFVVEHLSQEGYRLLITYSRPLLANLSQFIRMAFWCILFYVFSHPAVHLVELSLASIFGLWFVFALISVMMIAFHIRRRNLIEFTGFHALPSRIKTGLGISLTFFISTVLFKIIEFSSRYILDIVATKADVGIFTFYSNLTNLIYVTTHSVTIAVLYPQLIRSFNGQDSGVFMKIRKKFLREIIVVSVLVTFLILVTAPFLMELIDRPALKEHYSVLVVLLAGMIFYMLSYYPHYMLYLHRMDRAILISSFIAAGISFALNIVLTLNYGMMGSAYATALGFLTLFIVKFLFYKRRNTTLPVSPVVADQTDLMAD